MDAAAEAAIRRSDDAFAPDEIGETAYAFGDEVGMLDHIRRVADDARQDQLVIGQLYVAPHRVFVFVADIRGLEGIGADLDLEHHLDDVAHRQIGRMWPVPAAPAKM